MKKNKLLNTLTITVLLQLICVLGVLLISTSCKKSTTNDNSIQKEIAYPVYELTPTNTEIQNTYAATLKGEQDIDIKPRIEGYIEKIYVDEGAVVKKGQILFKINSPSSIESLERAKANYKSAELDVERIRPLAEKGIVSEVKLKAYENALASAKATLDQSTATISWTTVKSPTDGIVNTIDYREGSLVNNATILTTISNTSYIIAYFSLNENELIKLLQNYDGKTQAEKIKQIPDVKLLLSDNSEYSEKGRIETVSGRIDETSGTVVVRAKFPNTNGSLRSGSSARIIIPQIFKNALVIPQEATFTQQDRILVYKCQGDSVVQKVIKVLSSTNDDNYVVTEGLNSGDKIVSSGVISLTNGQKIKQNIIK